MPKNILFERSKQAYLPEIKAYIDFIENHPAGWSCYDSVELSDYNVNDFDVVWRFMGLDRKGDGKYIVHDYNSLSTQPFAKMKNHMKRIVNIRPNARVFLNHRVRDEFGFSDGVESTIRNMGIDKQFFLQENANPEYDFVYAGSLDRGTVILSMLDQFLYNMTGASLLAIGHVPDKIHSKYGKASNITFTGRVDYTDMAKLMAKARYGLNPIPDVYPYNIQTSTKLIEYCALGLPVISTAYSWSKSFMRERSGNFFFVQHNFEDLTMNRIEDFSFKTPDVSDLEWSHLLNDCKITDLLPSAL